MKAQQPKKQNKSWYKKWWGVALLVVFGGPLALGILAGLLSAIAQPTTDDKQNNTSVTTQDSATADKQKADDEVAAKELTRTLIEGYVPKYCQNHQDRKIPLPFEKDGNWQYDIENPTVKLSNQDYRNVITYLVNNINSSAQSLESISEAKISIGMSRHELLLAWGLPSDINDTVTASGKSSQWVYGNPAYGANYVYLDNDIITAIQN